MELAAPLGLLGLLALPVIVALHLLRPRPRRLTVASTWLWRAAVRERRRGMGLEKLLRDLSLLLLLLSALAAALALAGPTWLIPAGEAGDTVLVLDVSASMQARDGGGTRFDRARARAADAIDALPDDGRMLLMTSARRPRLLTAFERDRDALRRALAAVQPGDEAGRPREALELALALLRRSDEGRVRFVTDAAFDPDALPGSPRVTLDTVGGAARNVAITRLAVRRALDGSGGHEVLVAVRSWLERPIEVPLAVSVGGAGPALTRAMALPPYGVRTLVLPLPRNARGRLHARIDVDDDLAVDDSAYAVLQVPEPRRVLLASPGSWYLERALAALPEVLVSRVESLTEGAFEGAGRVNDVVVVDRLALPELPPGSWLLVDTVPPGAPFRADGRVDAPAIAGQGVSALMRDIDVTGVRIASAQRVVRDGDAGGALQRLFWSPETDLALAWADGKRRVVWLGFDPARSTLPVQAAFPLLVGRSVDWLAPARSERPGGADGAGVVLPAGEPFDIPGVPGGGEVVLRLPSGEGRIEPLPATGLRFEDTARAGVYGYTVNGVARQFAVNLTDPQESDPRPRAAAAVQAPRPAPGAGDRLAPRALWPWLAIAALALLLLEWAVWCGRRPRA